VVWRIVLPLEQSMGLTDEQWKASKAVVPDPPTEWLMGASLEGAWGTYSTASSRFCAIWVPCYLADVFEKSSMHIGRKSQFK
jgi:hypothetical protein